MLEKDVKDAAKKYLKEIGAWCFMPVKTLYGKKVVDFIVCYKGKFYAIETKRSEREKPTPLQDITMQEIEEAGGKCCVEFDVELPTLRRMLHED